jgi:tRNA-specific 2-thiouridylase
MRVVVAMSGGVDSSVAAARLVAEGHDVIGVTLHLWDYPDDSEVHGRCCAPEDVHDARRVSDVLGIPHYAFDRRELFQRVVVDPFVNGYLEGKTPSPCVHCNRGVKMQELLGLAETFAADAVATGHYARILRENGTPQLHRALDTSKDQSYFLHMLGPSVLARLTFPLGAATKAEVRAEAQRLGLPGAGKGESQELCFVASGRYDEFVAERADGRVRPGPILDGSGRVVGQHAGVHGFTVGQRKNLGVALGKRAYVVDVDAASGAVTLGDREELLAADALVEDVSLDPDIALPLECEVAVRYRGKPVPAVVEWAAVEWASAERTPETRAAPRRARVRLKEALPAIVPGQFAVFYQGDRVLGGGAICASERARGET